MKATLAVHSWNEAAALERLLLSSLHAAHLFDEWVVLDHRSSDDTQATLDALRPVLAAHGVTLTRLHEPRDLSRTLTFADVRTRTVKAAGNPVVGLMDADFILGAAYADVLTRALHDLTVKRTAIAAVAFPTPVVWDHLRTDSLGRITAHGRVWVHKSKARILHRDRTAYEQTGNGGKWERLVHTSKRHAGIVKVPNDGRVLISANLKSPDRIELRRTMTLFAEEAARGRHGDRTWLEAAERGDVAKMPPYPYVDVDLKGTSLNLANLDVAA